MPTKACVVCGAPSDKARCPAHRKAAASRPERGTAEYRQARLEVLIRDNYTCTWCRGPANEVDHYPIPYAAGGPSTPDNMVASCGPCNKMRGNRPGPPPTPIGGPTL